jgi:hypothetical protein
MRLDPPKCACVAMLGAAFVAAVQHTPDCAFGQGAQRVLCYAVPPEPVHGNHEQHRPAMPREAVITVTTSTSTTTFLGPHAGGALKTTLS